MATKRNPLTIRVPEDLKERIEKVATLQGVSINQFALYAVTKEIAGLEASSYFRNVLRGVNKKAPPPRAAVSCAHSLSVPISIRSICGSLYN